LISFSLDKKENVKKNDPRFLTGCVRNPLDSPCKNSFLEKKKRKKERKRQE
jgi:hypothetical protein